MEMSNDFVPKNTIIEKMNPNTKLLAIISLGISTLIFPNPALGLGVLIFLFVVSCIAKIQKTFLKVVLGFGIPITVMLLFIQGLYSPKNKTIIADLGFAQMGLEGVLYALKIVVTLLVFLGAFLLMNKTTHISNLVAALTDLGLPNKAGYLVLATLNVVPQMQKRMSVIRQSQEARGVETQGGLFNRIKAYIPLLGPVILSSLIDMQERGMTLETRGFGINGVRRTTYVKATRSPMDKPLNVILILFLLIVLILTLLIKFGSL
jgi:energy-coupling factor transport system permease protein